MKFSRNLTLFHLSLYCLAITGIASLVVMQTSCKPDEAWGSVPHSINVMVLHPQDIDSIGFSVTWQHPILEEQHHPIEHYLIRIVHNAEPYDTLASGQAPYPSVNDTVWMRPQPAPGDSLPYYAAVISVDTTGAISETWALSGNKLLVIPPLPMLPPPPPDSVDVTPILPDTIPNVSSVILQPRSINLIRGFGTTEAEFLGYTEDGQLTACVRAQLYEIIEPTYRLGVTTGGVCEGRDLTGAAPVFYIDGAGAPVTQEFWVTATLWDLPTVDPGDKWWRGTLFAEINSPTEAWLHQLPVQVWVEDIE